MPPQCSHARLPEDDRRIRTDSRARVPGWKAASDVVTFIDFVLTGNTHVNLAHDGEELDYQPDAEAFSFA